MRSIRVFVPLLLLLMSCTGCVQIRETITLQADGSGVARIQLAFLQLALRYLPGKPSEEWLQPHLPKGVRLQSFENEQQPTTFVDTNGKEHDLVNEAFDVTFAFDHVELLNELRVGPDARNEIAALAGGAPGQSGMQGMAKPDSEGRRHIGPFQELALESSEGELRFRRVVQAARSREQIDAARMGAPGSTAKTQSIDLQGAAMVVTIHCPGQVLEHNADEIDGNSLTWKYDLKELQEQQERDWTIEFTCRAGEQK